MVGRGGEGRPPCCRGEVGRAWRRQGWPDTRAVCPVPPRLRCVTEDLAAALGGGLERRWEEEGGAEGPEASGDQAGAAAGPAVGVPSTFCQVGRAQSAAGRPRVVSPLLRCLHSVRSCPADRIGPQGRGGGNVAGAVSLVGLR